MNNNCDLKWIPICKERADFLNIHCSFAEPGKKYSLPCKFMKEVFNYNDETMVICGNDLAAMDRMKKLTDSCSFLKTN